MFSVSICPSAMEVSVNDLKPNHARPDAAPIANHARLWNAPWPVTLIYNTSITQSNAFATCAYVVALPDGYVAADEPKHQSSRSSPPIEPVPKESIPTHSSKSITAPSNSDIYRKPAVCMFILPTRSLPIFWMHQQSRDSVD